MATKNNHTLSIFGLFIAFAVIYFPLILFVITRSSTWISSESLAVNIEAHSLIVVRTLCWSLGVGTLATCIGWPVGIRIASLATSKRNGVLAALIMTLAIPAYAVFYVWWQAWPAGTWIHAYLVEHSLIRLAMKVCLALALIGWSWPIAALFATMSTKTSNSLTTLFQLDGVSLIQRCWQRFLLDWRLIVSTSLFIASLTATNTTCFDLAQIATIGNELRAVLATGGSIVDAPVLSLVGLGIAIVASYIVFRFVTFGGRSWPQQPSSSIPIVFVWALLSGGPLLISAAVSLRGGGFQLWKYYQGDMLLSGAIGVAVAMLSLVLLISSTSLHMSPHHRTRVLANMLDFSWLFFAFLPASFISMIFVHAWNHPVLEVVYRSPLILVLLHIARVGFIASLAGRWIASCRQAKTLCKLDGVQTPRVLFSALRPQLLAASVVVAGSSMAMSIGEVAMTSQLPPAKYQPIAVALLSAMHYQRPEIVTSALFVIIMVALLVGLLVVYTNRKLCILTLMLLLPMACETHEQTPIQNVSVIGSVGLSDGKFLTPRAIDANDHVIVVIDKSGRVQRFDKDGVFLTSWELQLAGNGFPTGLTIDEDGLIWIADTHQHRVVVLAQDGQEVLQFGSYGTGDGQFLYPTDIAFGSHGEVFVSEYGGNDRINVFNRRGIYQRSFGHHGEDISGFKRPQSIAIEPNTGRLFIADSGNHRVIVCEPDGNVIQVISSAGRQRGELLYPYGIEFLTPTTFMVTEFGNNRLQEFTSQGDAVATWGGAGDQIGMFKTPWGIAMTKNGILIADTGNNRLELLPYIILNR